MPGGLFEAYQYPVKAVYLMCHLRAFYGSVNHEFMTLISLRKRRPEDGTILKDACLNKGIVSLEAMHSWET